MVVLLGIGWALARGRRIHDDLEAPKPRPAGPASILGTDIDCGVRREAPGGERGELLSRVLRKEDIVVGKLRSLRLPGEGQDREGELGRDGNELSSLRVTIAESPLARASYEAPLW